MLKTSILILALTVTLANGALAATKRPVLPADAYNSMYSTQSDDGWRLDQAKGNIQ